MAARMLARAGMRVALCDKAVFPRDKTCGDALIPDSIAALRHAGVWDRIAENARSLDLLDVISPRGLTVPIRGEYRVLRRRVFDEILFNEALASGAYFHHVSVKGPLTGEGKVTVVAIERGGRAEEIRAPLTVLATGAEA